jgi:hypothetical protein
MAPGSQLFLSQFDDHVEVLRKTLELMQEEFQRVVDNKLANDDR